MGSIYVKATNTGKGFITHADRVRFTLRAVTGDIYEVSGEYQDWVARVGGVEVPPPDLTAVVEESARAKLDRLEAEIAEIRTALSV